MSAMCIWGTEQDMRNAARHQIAGGPSAEKFHVPVRQSPEEIHPASKSSLPKFTDVYMLVKLGSYSSQDMPLLIGHAGCNHHLLHFS